MLPHRKHLSFLFAITIFLSLFTSCNLFQNNGTIQPTPAQCYVVPTSSTSILIDKDGNEIMQGEDLELLTPSFQEEIGSAALTAWDLPSYVAARRFTPSSETEFEATLSDVSSALYSVDGALLVDWQPYIYQPAFGKFLLRQTGQRYSTLYFERYDTTSSALFDPTTGEIVLEDVHTVIPLGNTHVALLKKDGTVHGIMDMDGNKVAGFPFTDAYTNIEKCGDYYLSTNSVTYQNCLLDNQFQPIDLPYDDIYYFSTGYFCARSNSYSVYEILESDSLDVIAVADDFSYFDGAFYISTNWNDDTPFSNTLYTIDGVEVLTHEGGIRPIDLDGDGIADRFYYSVVQDEIIAIDQEGNIVAQKTYPYAWLPMQLRGDILRISGGRPFAQDHEYFYLVDDDLNLLAPVEFGYEYYYYFPTKTANYLIAEHLTFEIDYSDFYVLLDTNGTVLCEQIDHIYSADDDRLVIEKDGYVGLIDPTGTWIYKTPVS